MNRSITVAMLLAAQVLLAGCAGTSVTRSLQAANTAAQVPVCRALLIEYLPPIELAGIGDELALLDSAYNGVRDAVARRPGADYSLALAAVLGSPMDRYDVERAFGTIVDGTRAYATASGRAAPPRLSVCLDDIARDWTDLTDMIDNGTGDDAASAGRWLDIAARVALALSL